MRKKKIDINWLQIIITAIITGLVSIIVAVIVFNYTNEKEELIYEEFPISTYQSDSTKISILNYSIKNIGKKKSEDIMFMVQLPKDVIIKEPNIKSSNSLTVKDIVVNSENSITYNVKNLYGNENFNVSLLVENMKINTSTKVELRSNASVGKIFKDSESSMSPTMVYIGIILVVLLIILFLVLIFSVKKAINKFIFIGKKLNEQSDIEEQKVRDIITQGVEYCDMGLIDDSIRVLIKGKYLHPESSSIHSNLARAYAKQEEFEKAESEFRVAKKIMIEDADKLIYHYTRAHYYALKKDKNNMLRNLQLAQEYGKDRVCEKMNLDEEFMDYKEDEEFLKLNSK